MLAAVVASHSQYSGTQVPGRRQGGICIPTLGWSACISARWNVAVPKTTLTSGLNRSNRWRC